MQNYSSKLLIEYYKSNLITKGELSLFNLEDLLSERMWHLGKDDDFSLESLEDFKFSQPSADPKALKNLYKNVYNFKIEGNVNNLMADGYYKDLMESYIGKDLKDLLGVKYVGLLGQNKSKLVVCKKDGYYLVIKISKGLRLKVKYYATKGLESLVGNIVI